MQFHGRGLVGIRKQFFWEQIISPATPTFNRKPICAESGHKSLESPGVELHMGSASTRREQPIGNPRHSFKPRTPGTIYMEGKETRVRTTHTLKVQTQ
jgi:hypothetical protein